MAPGVVRAYARELQGHPCVCGQQGKKLDAHHLVSRAQGGDDVRANLIGLCGDCHGAIHRGVDSTYERRLIRRALTALQHDYIVRRKGAGWLEWRYPT